MSKYRSEQPDKALRTKGSWYPDYILEMRRSVGEPTLQLLLDCATYLDCLTFDKEKAEDLIENHQECLQYLLDRLLVAALNISEPIEPGPNEKLFLLRSQGEKLDE